MDGVAAVGDGGLLMMSPMNGGPGPVGVLPPPLMDSGDFSQPHSDTGEQLKLAQQQQQMADMNGTPSNHISMRRQSFTPELIEEYLRRNKHRVRL